jgi:hypothetical protein
MTRKAEHIDGWFSLTELAAAASVKRAAAYLFLKHHAVPRRVVRDCVYVSVDDQHIQAYIAAKGDHRRRGVDRVFGLCPATPEGFATIADVARMAGVSREAVRRFVLRHSVAVVRGPRCFVRLDDPTIAAYIALARKNPQVHQQKATA